MYRDFVEMLSALRDAGADYLVVGAHALGCGWKSGGEKLLHSHRL